MTARVKAFLAFWYDFVVGDDWRIAAFVVAGLALTKVVAHASVPAWWLLPLGMAVALPLSIRRVLRAERKKAAGSSGGE